MEQAGLKAKDLIPYIGSASKVSEVLAGKRALSLAMIRKLVNELGIPAEVLLQEAGAKLPSDATLQQGKHFPVTGMVKRGWFAHFQGPLHEVGEPIEVRRWWISSSIAKWSPPPPCGISTMISPAKADTSSGTSLASTTNSTPRSTPRSGNAAAPIPICQALANCSIFIRKTAPLASAATACPAAKATSESKVALLCLWATKFPIENATG